VERRARLVAALHSAQTERTAAAAAAAEEQQAMARRSQGWSTLRSTTPADLRGGVSLLDTVVLLKVRRRRLKPMLKAPGTKRWKLKCDGPVSNFAFKFKLRRYIKEKGTLEFKANTMPTAMGHSPVGPATLEI
jgi:hypothetical protein